MKLVPNWRRLWRSWTIWAAGLGVLAPDVLQLIADNSDALPWLDDGYKSGIRLACLVAVLVLRPIKQQALEGKP